jgi:D-erythronate 2-dehydrogenase
MDVLVTGGAGFLGSRVIRRLLAGGNGSPPVSRIVSLDVARCPIEDARVESRVGSIADPAFVDTIVGADVVYHMAAVLSGQSEAEFDLGMAINVDATRRLLERCRRFAKPPRFIFTSSLAVFGGPMPDVVPEDMVLMPQSSYGAGKAIAELMVCEYSRRGFVDGLVCRLPTICVRPGKPNSAASSFVSGIIREPLGGIDSACPVPLATRLWIASPALTVGNLVHAATLPTAALQGRRTLNLPGLCVTAAGMLDSLERLGGRTARARVACTPEKRIIDIVCSWPGDFDVRRPLSLGFKVDADFDAIVRQYMGEMH